MCSHAALPAGRAPPCSARYGFSQCTHLLLLGTASAEALHTFTLDSGASRCFFRDSTNLTPLPAPVPVRLADPSGGPVLARSSAVLPCLAVPSGSLSGLHLPSFSTNLVSTAALQDAMVTTTTPRGQHVSICTCTQMGHHLATFTRQLGSSLYTLATEPPQVAASIQVSVSGPVAALCSCRLQSHQTLLWHHRLGHPSLPRLRGMHFCLFVSGLPRSLPPLSPSPPLPCLPCVEGRQRAAPHSSFPPTNAPLKGEVPDVLIPWIRTVCLQLREQFRGDLPVLRLHSDRGGEFSSDLLQDFFCGEGILWSFMLPASQQQNRATERRIGLVMEVARTSMIHAPAPHLQWPFAVQYAAHQLNLWPLVSLPETSPTLHWTGKVGDASVFRVWGSRAFVCDTSAEKLSICAIPCVFLGFPPDVPGWQFYHPNSRRVLPSHDVMFDESVPFYCLFPYRTAPLPPPPPSPLIFLAPVPPLVDPLPLVEPVEVAVDSGAARGAASGGAEPASVEPGPDGAEAGGAESDGAESRGAKPRAHTPSEWSCRSWRLRRWRAGGAGATSLGGAGVTAGAGGTGGAGAAGLGGARTRGTGVARAGGVGGVGAGDPGAGGTSAGGAGAGGARAGGTGALDPRAGGAGPRGAGAGGTGAGGTVQRRPFFVPPPPSPLPPLDSNFSVPAPTPYAEQIDSLTKRRELESRHALPVRVVCTGRLVPCPRPLSVPGTHIMALPHAASQRVTHCTCSRTGRHLATFTRRPGSSLYTLTTESPPVAASAQVVAFGQVFFAASRSSPVSAPCSCRPLSHETLLWHHRLGHPSLPRLRGMASRTLVSGLPQTLPLLPPGPAPTCVPCVEGRQHAAPHSSEFPPTEAPLQTLHMDVWGPARVRGQGHERYFLLVVDDYSRYTIVFPLRSKDRGGEFSSDLLRAFCRSEGIRQTFTLPASPFSVAVRGSVCCASDQPSASCLLAGDHTYSAMDGEGWRCVCVPCLGISSFCPQYFRGQVVLSCRQRVTHCTCSRTGRHLTTFTRRPGSSLYTLTTESPPVAASAQVVAFGQVFFAASRSSPVSAPCSCRPLSHETLLWHHRLGHPSLPRLRGMASRTLVSGLPQTLPLLPPGPAPTCVPCVEGRQHAAPHSSEFPPTEAPLQTLHMDVWGPARVRGQGHERYFLLVVDDYSRYTIVFPLRSKDRGGEFSSDLLRAFCRSEGIRQTFTLPASPFSVAVRGSVCCASDQPSASCLLAGDHTYSAMDGEDKLSSRAVPCVFLDFPPDAPWWQFYHPTSRRVLSSQDVTFDELVSYYHLVEPVEVAVDSCAARGAEPAGAGTGVLGLGLLCLRVRSLGVLSLIVWSLGVLSLGVLSLGVLSMGWYTLRSRRAAGARAAGGASEVAAGASGAGAAGGAAGAGAAGGAARAGAAGGTAAAGAAGPGGTGAGGTGAVGAAGGAGAAGHGGARTGGTGAAGAGGASGVGAASAGAVATGGAAGAGAVGVTGAGGAAGVVARDPRAEGTSTVSALSRNAARPRPYYVPLLQQVLGPPPPLLIPPPVQPQLQLQPASPLPGPSPYSGSTRGLTEHREPESRPASPESRSESLVHAVHTGRSFPRQRPPPVPGTHSMTLRPSTAPQCVPLPSPPASSLPDGPDLESNSLRAASPTVTRFLATTVTDPLFESTAASAHFAELVDFVAACRIDYATSLVAESASASVCPPSVGGECALRTQTQQQD
ncbi:unnamed protein product [Closterium sp. NIES-53]